ncbi:MAG: hypothetical protein ACYDEX_02195 [Mobilitalea sp.]
MFVFGETKEKVVDGKLALPKEYHLKKRNLVGKWRDEQTLYLSDNEKSLNRIAGKRNESFIVYLDMGEKISIPDKYENFIVEIKGCITAIELVFFICD